MAALFLEFFGLRSGDTTRSNHRPNRRRNNDRTWPGSRPNPLPPRPRALSLIGNDFSTANTALDPPIHIVPESVKVDSQVASPLFHSLPGELRHQIYTYVLSGRIIHLGLETQDVNRLTPYLRHFYCRETDLDSGAVDSKHGCWFPKGGRPRDPEEKILALLLTCRRIYSEAITILYSTNLFHLNNLLTFLWLPTLILPSRVHSIRTLTLVLEFRAFPMRVSSQEATRFTELWTSLAAMQGLKRLYVYIAASDAWDKLWIERKEGWVQRDAVLNLMRPLMQRMDVFKVFWPLSEQASGDVVEWQPFCVWHAR